MEHTKKLLVYLDRIKTYRDDIVDYLIEPEHIKIKIKEESPAFKKITLNLIKHDLKRLTDKEIILWEESQ